LLVARFSKIISTLPTPLAALLQRLEYLFHQRCSLANLYPKTERNDVAAA
jgi:hypothetical protein